MGSFVGTMENHKGTSKIVNSQLVQDVTQARLTRLCGGLPPCLDEGKLLDYSRYPIGMRSGGGTARSEHRHG